MRLRSTLIAILLGFATVPASADSDTDSTERVAELSAQLAGEKSEKERIAAVTALGRLNDKKTLKPLVVALRDKSATVRAVAALALGKLGHRAALPALRDACDDDDELVRKRAKEAVVKVSEANDIEIEPAQSADTTTTVKKAKKKAGFGSDAKALPARPDLYVVVRSATDDSAGESKKAKNKKAKQTRKMHAEIAKLAMIHELDTDDTVTAIAKDADRYGLDPHNIDVIITELATRTSGGYIEVEATLRLTISDDRGKMTSSLTGGAKVQVKKASFDNSYLPQLRREAIENAVRGLFDKLLAHLRKGANA